MGSILESSYGELVSHTKKQILRVIGEHCEMVPLIHSVPEVPDIPYKTMSYINIFINGLQQCIGDF